MRLDTLFLDQPGQHGGCAISRITSKLSRLHAKAFFGALNHRPGSAHFGRTDGTRGFNIDDDGMLGIDQIVVGIGKERRVNRTGFAGGSNS